MKGDRSPCWPAGRADPLVCHYRSSQSCLECRLPARPWDCNRTPRIKQPNMQDKMEVRELKNSQIFQEKSGNDVLMQFDMHQMTFIVHCFRLKINFKCYDMYFVF